MVFAEFPRFSRRDNQIEPRKRLDALWTEERQIFCRTAAVSADVVTFFEQNIQSGTDASETHRPQGSTGKATSRCIFFQGRISEASGSVPAAALAPAPRAFRLRAVVVVAGRSRRLAEGFLGTRLATTAIATAALGAPRGR